MKKKKSNTNYIIMGIIIVLLSFSLVQAVQINSLKDKISEGSVAYASPQKTFQAQAPLKAPTMVGGC